MDCNIALDASFGLRVDPCRRRFDFTLDFEHWVLSLIPDILFIFGACVRCLWILRTDKMLTVRSHGLARAKLAAASLLLAMKTASLIAWTTAGDAATPAAVASSSAAFISAIILIPISHYEHSRNARPSALLCLYLLATVLFEVAQVRTLWLLQPLNLVLAAIATVSLALRCLFLAIEVSEKRLCSISAPEKASPEYRSGILNRSVYWWINDLFFQGFRSDLSLQSLYSLDENLTSKALTSDLQRRWSGDENKHSKKYALLQHTFASAKWTIIKAVVARTILIPLKYAQPFLFSDLIERVSEPNKTDQAGIRYGLLGAMLLVYTLLAATNAIYKRQTILMMTAMRGSLIGIIFAEALQDKERFGSGANALTLMSTDVDRIVTGVQNVHEMWAAGIEIVIAFALLILRIGYPSVAALVVAAACIAGSSYIAPRMREKQRLWVQAVQERVSFTTSILKVMRQVKMLGIEMKMTEKIHQFRKLELDASKPFRLLIVGVNVLNAAATSIAPALTIILYTTTRMSLRTEIPKTDAIFTSLSLVSLLTSSATLLSLALTKFTSGMGSFDRIQKYLLAGEKQNETSCLPTEIVDHRSTELTVMPGTELLHVKGSSFRYDGDGECQLNDLTFTVSRSEIVAVTGSHTCSKSTLLKAVLGEILRVKGQLAVRASSVAYCQQVPYIFNGTSRSNIVGGAHGDDVWLERVLHSCDLVLDISRLPEGFETVVGSSGLQLSGGQKQRVVRTAYIWKCKMLIILQALARAVFAKPDFLCYKPEYT